MKKKHIMEDNCLVILVIIKLMIFLFYFILITHLYVTLCEEKASGIIVKQTK